MKIIHRVLTSFILFIALTAGGTILPEIAEATSVVSLTDEQLVQNSDYIIHGTILKTEAMRFDEHTIITRVTILAHEYLKTCDEEKREIFEFYTRGGCFGDFVQNVSGEFVPAEGTEIVVFLEKIHRYEDRPMLLGLTQGVFVIHELPMTRSDRKASNYPIRTREFVKVPTHFDSLSDLSELKQAIRDEIMHTNQGAMP